jgi:hypothetical protein
MQKPDNREELTGIAVEARSPIMMEEEGGDVRRVGCC